MNIGLYQALGAPQRTPGGWNPIAHCCGSYDGPRLSKLNPYQSSESWMQRKKEKLAITQHQCLILKHGMLQKRSNSAIYRSKRRYAKSKHACEKYRLSGFIVKHDSFNRDLGLLMHLWWTENIARMSPSALWHRLYICPHCRVHAVFLSTVTFTDWLV